MCVCDMEHGYFNSGYSGVVAHIISVDGIPVYFMGYVERCDMCERYDSDHEDSLR